MFVAPKARPTIKSDPQWPSLSTEMVSKMKEVAQQQRFKMTAVATAMANGTSQNVQNPEP